MRILKSNPLLGLLNSYLIDAPQPANISYLWNFGSLLGLCLVIQIVTGVTLAIHYTPNVDLAFISVEHIIRDVNYGWFIRYLHANTASFFFIFLYAHVGRGLYYGSYRWPRSLPWIIGVIILVLTMATAFLGYFYSPKWYKNKRYLSNKIFNKYINVIKQKRYYSKDIKPKKKDVEKNNNNNNNGVNYLDNFLKYNGLTPAYTYNNLGSDITIDMIKTELKDISGIYAVFNTRTGDYYIGCATTGRLYNRFRSHLITFKGNKKVKRAISKYNLADFVFLILEVVPGIVNKKNFDNYNKLYALEDLYIRALQPYYNCLIPTGVSLFYSTSKLKEINFNKILLKKIEEIENLNKNLWE